MGILICSRDSKIHHEKTVIILFDLRPFQCAVFSECGADVRSCAGDGVVHDVDAAVADDVAVVRGDADAGVADAGDDVVVGAVGVGGVDVFAAAVVDGADEGQQGYVQHRHHWAQFLQHPER